MEVNLAEFICESDAIENISDNAGLVVKQIEQRKSDGHVGGHVGAMLWLESLVQSPMNSESHLTQELVCKVQGLITAEQYYKCGGTQLESEFVGCYRPEQVEMIVGIRECLSSFLVPAEMAKLLDKAKWWQENFKFYGWSYNLNFIADFHFRFLIIHPFADGNGRTDRALAYYLMRWAGLNPFVFTSADKHLLYYPCFQDPDESALMREYFFIKMENNK